MTKDPGDRLAEIEARLGMARDALRSDMTAYPVNMTRDAADILASLLDDAITALRDEAREAVAAWMIAHSYPTGHGDTLDDLLGELVEHVRDGAIEECAKIVDSAWALSPGVNRGLREMAAEIRALKSQEAG